MSCRIEQILFSFNLAPLQGVILEEMSPLSGIIKLVLIHWPDGCDALVDVRVGRRIMQFCPREGFLALNDASPTFPFLIKVKEGDAIWCELRNGDEDNPHNITATVSVEGSVL